jgi:hypothetical protein
VHSTLHHHHPPQRLGHLLGCNPRLHQSPSRRLVQVGASIDRSGVVLWRSSSDSAHQGLAHSVHRTHTHHLAACMCGCVCQPGTCVHHHHHHPGHIHSRLLCLLPCALGSGRCMMTCVACIMHGANRLTQSEQTGLTASSVFLGHSSCREATRPINKLLYTSEDKTASGARWAVTLLLRS